MMGSAFKLWRAFATAAVAAAMLPSGVALSNYSGPYARTRILRPPYNFSDHGGAANCAIAQSCGYDGNADTSTGRMRTEAFVSTTAQGLAPGGLSDAFGSATLHIVDHFRAGTTDNALYRFYVEIDGVTQNYPLVAAGAGAFGSLFFRVQPSCTPCGGAIHVEDLNTGTTSHTVDIVVNGAFKGDVNIDVFMESDASLTLGIGTVSSEASVRIARIKRIW